MTKLLFAIVGGCLLAWVASANMILTSSGPPVTPGSVWNPSDKNADANLTLSTGTFANDTATVAASSGGFRAVRGTQSYATGSSEKRVFTIIVTLAGAGNGWIGGVGTTGATLNYPGGSANGIGTQASSGAGSNADYKDGSTSGSACGGGASPNFITGGTVWIAIDFSAGVNRFWCSKNCTAWLGGNPGTGTSPFTLSGGTYLPMWGGFGESGGDTARLDTKPTLTGCTNLTGFSVWG